MPESLPEILEDKRDGDRLRLLVRHDGQRYHVVIAPSHGASREIVGYRYWIGNHTPLLGDEDRAVTQCLAAVTRLHST